MTARRRLALVLLGTALVLPEIVLYLASAPGDVPEARGHCRVLVLGFPPRRDGTPGSVERFRMRVAQRTLEEYRCATVVLSGGSPRSPRPEAEAMADVARELRLEPERLILEKDSRTTWQNVRNSLPALEGPDHVFIASDPAHARRALWYLCRQSPELCPRAHVAARYRPFDMFWYQWISAPLALQSWLRDRASLALGRGARL